MPKQRNTSLTLHLGTTEGNNAVTLSGQEASRHKWIVGISGSGKSTFLAWLVLQLMRQGITVNVLDPHGDLARLILSLLQTSGFFHDERAYQRLWFVDFARKDAAIAFNVLKQEHTDNYQVASDFLDAIHRAFPTTSGTTAALDNTVQYVAFVLAENGVPITHLQQFLLDKKYRDSLLAPITDKQIVQFFDFKFSDKVSSQLIDSTMRRLDLLTFSPILRNSVGQKENKLNFRYLYDNGVSCIMSLGRLSESEKRLLGCLLLVSIEQAFLSRVTLSPEKRTPVHVFVDEAPLFVSHSETAFTTILEQARKAGATLYFAHQTLQQLPKSMAGSLQNCLPIMMKAGSLDSSELTSRFYRPATETTPDFFDFLPFHTRTLPSAFANVKNTGEARMVFENLRRQEAIVMLPDGSVKIVTPTLPVTVDQKKLAKIENTYAQKLLTPLPAKDNASSSHKGVPSAPAPLHPVKRRVPLTPSTIITDPLQTFVGALGTEDELRSLFTQYGYLTVSQVARILQKETSINNIRSKLKRLVDVGVLETQSVPRTSPSGKTPLVYTLVKKGSRKHEFLEHALATSEVLLNTALLPTIAPLATIVAMQADHTLKASPLQLPAGNTLVPDGYVRLHTHEYEYAFYFEIDRNTESKEKIASKLIAYKALASQCDCMTVAFCITEGGDLRVKTLRKWAQEVLPVALRELFVFAPIDLTNLTPSSLFQSPLWSSVDDTTLQSLVET